MSAAWIILWGAVGWCGTPWPWWWRKPPPPPPDPWWFVDRIVGIVGGVIGGLLYNGQWAVEAVDQTGDPIVAVIASSIGALIGAIILLDLYFGFVRGRAGETTGTG